MDGKTAISAEITRAMPPRPEAVLASRQTPAPDARITDNEVWSRLFDQAAVGIIHADKGLRVLKANRRIAEMLGYGVEEFAGKTVSELTFPDDRLQSRQVVERLSPAHPVYHWEKRYLHKNGSPVWVSVAISALYDAAGKPQSYFAVMEDIGERRSQAEMLASEKRILEHIASGMELNQVLEEIALLWEQRSKRYPHCAVTLSSTDGEHVWVAAAPTLPAAFKGMMWGRSEGSFLFTGAQESIIQDLETDTGAVPEQGILQALGVRACWRRPVIGGKGQVIGALVACSPCAAQPEEADRAFMERLLHLVCIAIEKSHVEQEATQLASFDRLTGLANRSVLLDRLHRALARGVRRGSRTALFLLNLDGMSRINESLGYAFGDEFIKTVARRLRGCLKPHETVARFGGDEFALLVEDAPDGVSLEIVAQRLLDSITRPLKVAGQEIFVTASLGLGIAADAGTDADALFRQADAALHRAKARGGNSFRCYSPDMDTSAGRLELLAELRHALERGEFLVHYQPQQGLRDGSVAGMEALMRWMHPRRGLVPPSEFIPLLEETGLILPAGEWLVHQVCRDIARLADAGLAPPRVAVNLSPRQFHQPDLAERIAGILQEAGVAGEYLEVEITESLMMQEPELTARALQQLKDIQVRIAVDDFGIGYSSFNYLKRFPVDALKVDKSFVDGVTEEGTDAVIAEAIIRLAHSLGMQTVAEGVESEPQRAFLAARGCDELQGYLYSQPLDYPQLTTFLAAQRDSAHLPGRHSRSAIIADKR